MNERARVGLECLAKTARSLRFETESKKISAFFHPLSNLTGVAREKKRVTFSAHFAEVTTYGFVSHREGIGRRGGTICDVAKHVDMPLRGAGGLLWPCALGYSPARP